MPVCQLILPSQPWENGCTPKIQSQRPILLGRSQNLNLLISSFLSTEVILGQSHNSMGEKKNCLCKEERLDALFSSLKRSNGLLIPVHPIKPPVVFSTSFKIAQALALLHLIASFTWSLLPYCWRCGIYSQAEEPRTGPAYVKLANVPVIYSFR